MTIGPTFPALLFHQEKTIQYPPGHLSMRCQKYQRVTEKAYHKIYTGPRGSSTMGHIKEMTYLSPFFCYQLSGFDCFNVQSIDLKNGFISKASFVSELYMIYWYLKARLLRVCWPQKPLHKTMFGYTFFGNTCRRHALILALVNVVYRLL